MSEEILTKRIDAVLEIRLNRPAKKNALTQAMYGAMADTLDMAASDDSIKAVMIAAEGDMFTAGNDIMDFAAFAQSANGSTQGSPVMRFLKAIAHFEKPVVAAVQGNGVGIGMTMLLHCDVVVIAEDAELSVPFTQLGLTPEFGSSQLLQAQVGYKQAYLMLALGQPVSGTEAVAYGIATDSVPRDEVEDQALDMAELCASRPSVAMQKTKQLMRNSEQIVARIDQEQDIFEDRLRSPEAIAAFQAFFSRK